MLTPLPPGFPPRACLSLGAPFILKDMQPSAAGAHPGSGRFRTQTLHGGGGRPVPPAIEHCSRSWGRRGRVPAGAPGQASLGHSGGIASSPLGLLWGPRHFLTLASACTTQGWPVASGGMRGTSGTAVSFLPGSTLSQDSLCRGDTGCESRSASDTLCDFDPIALPLWDSVSPFVN